MQDAQSSLHQVECSLGQLDGASPALAADSTRLRSSVAKLDRDIDICVGELVIALQDERGLLSLTSSLQSKVAALGAEGPCTEPQKLATLKRETEQLRLQSETVAPRRQLVSRGDGDPRLPYDTLLGQLDGMQRDLTADSELALLRTLLLKFREPVRRVEESGLRTAEEVEANIKQLMASPHLALFFGRYFPGF